MPSQLDAARLFDDQSRYLPKRLLSSYGVVLIYLPKVKGLLFIPL